MVIIRPRGGNFEYSEDEADIMIQDIKLCKDLGAYGVVIGALKGNTIDLDLTRKMVEAAKPMKITFHMAFDSIDDKKSAIDDLVKLGVDRILTKGGCENALAGKDKLKELVDYAEDRIIIMPGKGVNRDNREYILEYTGSKEIHGTKVVQVQRKERRVIYLNIYEESLEFHKQVKGKFEITSRVAIENEKDLS